MIAAVMMISVCCHCKRECGPTDARGYRHSFGKPLALAQQENASHGVCVECFVAIYGPLDAADEEPAHV